MALVPVPLLSALVPEKNDTIVAPGAAAADDTGGIDAADSFGPL